MKMRHLTLTLLTVLSFTCTACKSETAKDTRHEAPENTVSPDVSVPPKTKMNSKSEKPAGLDDVQNEKNADESFVSEYVDPEPWPEEKAAELTKSYTKTCSQDEGMKKKAAESRHPDKLADFCHCVAEDTVALIQDLIPDYAKLKAQIQAGKDTTAFIQQKLIEIGGNKDSIVKCERKVLKIGVDEALPPG